MPRKSRKTTDSAPEPAPAAAQNTILIEPIEPDAPAKVTPGKPAEKPARKSRSRKASAAAPAADETSVAATNAEAEAQAADTFEDAMEANDASEARTPAPAPEAPKKKARTPKTKAAAKPEPQAEPEPQPEQEPQEVGPDEDDELEGDWESGSGSEDDEEEEERSRAPRPPAKLERLQKILAAAGVASRRHAENLITEGRVQVNGKVVTTLGSKADAGRDHIRVDGKLLHGAERLRYFVLNKPRGYVTTVSDPEGRPTVMEFFAKMNERLYPVGRLDYLSEGLLLMTNDGELANKLTRAASGVEKTYLVKVSGQPNEDLVDQIRQGISIDKGRPGEGRVRTAPAHIRQVRVGENPWYEIGLIEGRNRELRKMFEEIGHHVEKIRRVGYGPLVLDQEPGNFRELDAEELQVLRLAAEGKWKPKRVKTTAMLPPHSGRSVDHEKGKPRSGGGGKPFRGREDRRPPARPSGTGDRREASRPGYGRAQERGRFERPARPPQGGFAGRTGQPPRPEQSPRPDQPAARGAFSDRRGPGSRPGRDFSRRRPEGESDRGARGGIAPRPGGFNAERGAGAGNARRPGGFGPERGGSARAGSAGGANRSAGPRPGGRQFADRGASRPFENRGAERPRFTGGERSEGGQGERFRPRPQGAEGGGFAPRPGGRAARPAGEKPQGRPAFGRGNFGGPPRGASAGARSRGPSSTGAGSRPVGGGPAGGGQPRTGGAGAGQFNRPGGTGGPSRGPSGGGGSRGQSGGPRGGPGRGGSGRGPSSQGRSNSSRSGPGRGGSGRGSSGPRNSGPRPGSRPPR